jgi:hypothetical protein
MDWRPGPDPGFYRGLIVGSLLEAALIVIVLAMLTACSQLPSEVTLPTSRTALANPNCWSRCYVSVTSTDDNKTGAGTFSPSGTRSGTITETVTEVP